MQKFKKLIFYYKMYEIFLVFLYKIKTRRSTFLNFFLVIKESVVYNNVE